VKDKATHCRTSSIGRKIQQVNQQNVIGLYESNMHGILIIIKPLQCARAVMVGCHYKHSSDLYVKADKSNRLILLKVNHCHCNMCIDRIIKVMKLWLLRLY